MNEQEVIEIAQQIQGWMEPVELRGLYEMAQKYLEPGGKILEVGSWKGRSSFVLAYVAAEKKGSLICLDTFTGSELNEAHYKEAVDMGPVAFMDTHIKRNLARMPVSYMVGNSTVLHAEIPDNVYDMVLVDGNHCDPVISQDLTNYYKKVKQGKLFAAHDYADVCPDVVRAVNDIFGTDRIVVAYRSLIGIIKT